MKNNNESETSKIRSIINKLFGLSSDKGNIQQRDYDKDRLVSEAIKAKEIQAKRQAEILEEKQGNQLQSSSEQGDSFKILAPRSCPFHPMHPQHNLRPSRR